MNSLQRWVDVGGVEVKRQDPAFTSFETSLKSLFWAVLGMMPYDAADIVVGNVDLNPECRSTTTTTTMAGNESSSSSSSSSSSQFRYSSSSASSHRPPPSTSTQRPVILEHKPTEWTSHLLYAFYHVLTTVILMNMLIAIMSSSPSHWIITDFSSSSKR